MQDAPCSSGRLLPSGEPRAPHLWSDARQPGVRRVAADMEPSPPVGAGKGQGREPQEPLLHHCCSIKSPAPSPQPGIALSGCLRSGQTAHLAVHARVQGAARHVVHHGGSRLHRGRRHVSVKGVHRQRQPCRALLLQQQHEAGSAGAGVLVGLELGCAVPGSRWGAQCQARAGVRSARLALGCAVPAAMRAGVAAAGQPYPVFCCVGTCTRPTYHSRAGSIQFHTHTHTHTCINAWTTGTTRAASSSALSSSAFTGARGRQREQAGAHPWGAQEAVRSRGARRRLPCCSASCAHAWLPALPRCTPGHPPEPGRVDCPPTSMMSAPASAMRRACATAAATPACRPPSLNESGVTLRMPMT